MASKDPVDDIDMFAEDLFRHIWFRFRLTRTLHPRRKYPEETFGPSGYTADVGRAVFYAQVTNRPALHDCFAGDFPVFSKDHHSFFTYLSLTAADFACSHPGDAISRVFVTAAVYAEATLFLHSRGRDGFSGEVPAEWGSFLGSFLLESLEELGGFGELRRRSCSYKAVDHVIRDAVRRFCVPYTLENTQKLHRSLVARHRSILVGNLELDRPVQEKNKMAMEPASVPHGYQMDDHGEAGPRVPPLQILEDIQEAIKRMEVDRSVAALEARKTRREGGAKSKRYWRHRGTDTSVAVPDPTQFDGTGARPKQCTESGGQAMDQGARPTCSESESAGEDCEPGPQTTSGPQQVDDNSTKKTRRRRSCRNKGQHEKREDGSSASVVTQAGGVVVPQRQVREGTDPSQAKVGPPDIRAPEGPNDPEDLEVAPIREADADSKKRKKPRKRKSKK